MPEGAEQTMGYVVYLLRCEDGSLYTGITTDLARRFVEHTGQSGRGAKYTAVHRPLRVDAAFFAPDRAQASRLEAGIKRLTRAQKERLIQGEKPSGLNAIRLYRAQTDEKGGLVFMLLIGLDTCTTCKKARAFLEARGIAYQFRDVREDKPTEEELRRWHSLSVLPIGRFYNTSGKRYRELGVSEKRAAWSPDEHYSMLASDGMLVKRPILIAGERVLVGFKPAEWEAAL